MAALDLIFANGLWACLRSSTPLGLGYLNNINCTCPPCLLSRQVDRGNREKPVYPLNSSMGGKVFNKDLCQARVNHGRQGAQLAWKPKSGR